MKEISEALRKLKQHVSNKGLLKMLACSSMFRSDLLSMPEKALNSSVLYKLTFVS